MNTGLTEPNPRGHHFAPKLRCAAAAGMLAVLTTGCAYFIPVPTAYHLSNSRRNVDLESAQQFRPGHTTTDDVVLTLGEPDRADPDASRLVYLWERVNLHMAWGWMIPLGKSSGIGRSWERIDGHAYSLVFEFSERGVLRQIIPSDAKTQEMEYHQSPRHPDG